MPVKIACAAGHKLVIAGGPAERPLVCPRCGLPVVTEPMGPENSAPLAAARAPAGAIASEPVVAGSDVLPPPVVLAGPTPQVPVIRVQAAGAEKYRWKPGAGVFGGVLFAAAAASAIPAVAELAAALGGGPASSSSPPARWALLLVWLALLQAAYAVYGWLWSNSASRRIVTLALVGQAGVYAALLAIVLLANPRGWILGSGGLQLTSAMEGGKAALVCLSLICLCAILTLFAARESTRRRSIEAKPRSAGR